MITTADFKRGLVIQLDNAPCLILDYTTQSPSARGGNTLVKVKYRNLLTAQVLEKAFKSGDRVNEADFERRKGCGIVWDFRCYGAFQCVTRIGFGIDERAIDPLFVDTRRAVEIRDNAIFLNG